MDLVFIFTLAFIIAGVLLFSWIVFKLLSDGFLKSSIILLFLGNLVAFAIIKEGDFEFLVFSNKNYSQYLNFYIYLSSVLILTSFIYFSMRDRSVNKKASYNTEKEVLSLKSDIKRAEEKLTILESDNWLSLFKGFNGEITLTDNEYGRDQARKVAIDNLNREIDNLKFRVSKLKGI